MCRSIQTAPQAEAVAAQPVDLPGAYCPQRYQQPLPDVAQERIPKQPQGERTEAGSDGEGRLEWHAAGYRPLGWGGCVARSAVACTCPRDALCAACRATTLGWLRGAAGRRGTSWAQHVAARRPELWPLAWPAHEGRAAEIAARRVADLAIDPLVRAELAVACREAAAQWWAVACCPAQDSARVHARWCRREQEVIGRELPGRFG